MSVSDLATPAWNPTQRFTARPASTQSTSPPLFHYLPFADHNAFSGWRGHSAGKCVSRQQPAFAQTATTQERRRTPRNTLSSASLVADHSSPKSTPMSVCLLTSCGLLSGMGVSLSLSHFVCETDEARLGLDIRLTRRPGRRTSILVTARRSSKTSNRLRTLRVAIFAHATRRSYSMKLPPPAGRGWYNPLFSCVCLVGDTCPPLDPRLSVSLYLIIQQLIPYVYASLNFKVRVPAVLPLFAVASLYVASCTHVLSHISRFYPTHEYPAFQVLLRDFCEGKLNDPQRSLELPVSHIALFVD